MTDQSPALFTEKVSCRGRTYFFDVKEASTGTKYLVISESRRTDDGKYSKNRIMVFENNLEAFSEAFTKALKAINEAAGT
ncbi:DUF3276 family protein [candidate division WOR-3 bacterium]|nr:DUF3276 family protein [candidate division WOR-3 bacterium]